jgi:hypothetical protein
MHTCTLLLLHVRICNPAFETAIVKHLRNETPVTHDEDRAQLSRFEVGNGNKNDIDGILEEDEEGNENDIDGMLEEDKEP